MDQLTLTVVEAGRLLGIGRNSAYEAVHTGAIPAIRIGRRLLVSRAALEELLQIEVLKGDQKESPYACNTAAVGPGLTRTSD